MDEGEPQRAMEDRDDRILVLWRKGVGAATIARMVGLSLPRLLGRIHGPLLERRLRVTFDAGEPTVRTMVRR